MLYLAEENATGIVYLVEAPDGESVYRIVGEKAFKMEPPITDTGNVDINVVRIDGAMPCGVNIRKVDWEDCDTKEVP